MPDSVSVDVEALSRLLHRARRAVRNLRQAEPPSRESLNAAANIIEALADAVASDAVPDDDRRAVHPDEDDVNA